MKKLIYFLFFILFISNSISAQSSKKIKSFTEESNVFIDELNTFMSSSSSEELGKFMKKFSKNWKKGIYSSDKQKGIYDISNALLKKRKRPSHFLIFLESLESFSRNQTFNSEFGNWSHIVKEMIPNSSTSQQLKFLVFSRNLFNENLLVTNRSLSWKVSSSTFSFEYDSVPHIVFKEPLDLTCIARGDTLVVRQTSGRYTPLKTYWIGKEGLMDWNKAGYTIAEVYAELSDYSINTSRAGFKADSVLFYNSNVFDDKPIKGSFEDKLVKRKKTETSSFYPKFDSYDKNIVLSDLIEDVDFEGGYSLHGDRFVSNSGDGHTADLVFYRNDKKFIVISSSRIAISGKRVIASNASMKMLFDNDSIVHPGLNLSYNQEDRRLDLNKDDSGISVAPYINTYHDLEMNFQNLNWYIDDDSISFGSMAGNSSGSANFESSNYFKEDKFDNLLGLDSEHPLLRIQKFAKKYAVDNEFLIQDFLNLSNYSDDQDIRYLINLAAKGYIIYNSITGKGLIKENVSRSILAKSKKIDFEELNFFSEFPKDGKNALLDLNTMNLTIYGVSSVKISSVRDVIAFPTNNEVVVRKGRDFSMGGKLLAGNAGRFRINSEAIEFNYEEFKLYFQDATTQIWIPNNRGEYNQKGNLVLEPIESEITISNGELLVDTSINKSGIWQEDYPQYPIIRSYDRSKVYYDDINILGGVYDRNKFFFDIDPFEIDSLDTYDRTSLSFPGVFNSGDIFPTFEQELRVQEDNILGFSILIAEDGLPLYVDKGYFEGNNYLSLDKSGLRGEGNFTYLTSITESKDYIFYLDSMNTNALSFNLIKKADGVQFPQAKALNVYEHWEPYNDVLEIKNNENAFAVYDDKLSLDGHLFLRPEGLKGGGLINLDDSKLNSELYTFDLEEFYSDTADFALERTDIDALAFESINLQTKINMVSRVAQFNSNGSGSFVKFPSNKYICYIDELKWFMDKKEVVLGNIDGFGSGSKFISIHDDQDSLSFVSKSSTYNLNDYIIKANGVDEIEVADAVISPSDGKLVVRSNAKMDKLSKASIVVNKAEKYHNLYDSDIEIFGKRDYSGLGFTKYLGRGVQDQVIELDTIFVLDNQTIAKGEISENDNFKFNPQFLYKGSVQLEGLSKEFLYTGSYKIKHDCSLISNGWVKFSDYVGNEKMRLPVGENILDEYDQRLYIGPILSGDQLYPAFLSTLESENDKEMMPINGYLSYDNSKSLFIVTDATDTTEGATTLTMSNSGCIMKGEGSFNFGLDFGQVEFSNTGEFTYNAMSNSLSSTSMMSFDFFMSPKAMDQLGTELKADLADELELNEKYYINNFNRILSDPDLVFEYEMFGEFDKLPKELKRSIYFYEVKLEWDSESNSLISKNSLGLGNVNDFQVNKLFLGKIELAKESSGDFFNIYFDTDIGESYFFGYSNELLISRSTIDEYNIEILEVKTQNRKLDTKKGEVEFQYDLSSEDDVDNFKKRFFR